MLYLNSTGGCSMHMFLSNEETLDCFLVKKPLEAMSQEIEKDISSKILLGGGRLTGKSSILQYLGKKNKWTDHQFIYMKFDPSDCGRLARDPQLNFSLYQCHYEIQFCNRLLSYIEEYYRFSFPQLYGDLIFSVEELSRQFFDYLEKCSSLENIPFTYSSIAPFIVRRIREDISPVSLSLIIDRFDWINNGNIFAQEILSKYFPLFDKVVVTTDDRDILDFNRQKRLAQCGYSYIESTYGMNIDVVKEMIFKRVNYCNHNLNLGEKPFPVEKVLDDTYSSLINIADGNLFIILKSISDMIDGWQYDTDFSIKEFCEKRGTREVQKRKELERVFFPKQFYL